MSFDLAASLRRLKPEKRVGRIERREDGDLPFAGGDVAAGPPLLLDTTVYIDALQDRLPSEVADLMSIRQIEHSSIATAELAYALGRLDPGHSATMGISKRIRNVIDAMPAHRLNAPSVGAIVDAGLVTGAIIRLRGLTSDRKQSLFNDSTLFFQAYEQGCHLLSRNVADMDYLLQLFPAGRVLLYRRPEPRKQAAT